MILAEQSVRKPPGTLLIMSDADVLWLRREAPDAILRECGSGADILAMDQGINEGEYPARINAGFIVSCGSPRARAFWTSLAALRLGWNATARLSRSRVSSSAAEWRRAIDAMDDRLTDNHKKAFKETPRINDQTVLNYELSLARGLRWERLNSSQFANGCTIKEMSAEERRAAATARGRR